jgi:hypothetical protein
MLMSMKPRALNSDQHAPYLIPLKAHITICASSTLNTTVPRIARARVRCLC